MTELAYDPLEFTRQLEATGCPREQAEVHVRAMTSQYLKMVESLATRDFLDARLVATRAELDRSLVEMQAALEAKLDKGFADIELRFEKADGKFRLLFWMQAITFAAVVLPALRDFIS